MLERDFSKIVKKWLTEQGIYHFKKPQGKFVTRKGISDYILCIKGRFISLELKTSIGKLSKSQQEESDRVEEADGIYQVARPNNWSCIKKFLVELSND